MGRKIHQTLIIALCCLWVSCKKDKPGTTTNTAPTGSGSMYIVCEGQYTAGNASLYAYQPATKTVYGDLYKSANGGDLGDVFQSLSLVNDKFFLCVNNSAKVAVIDTHSYKLVTNISIPGPRYILQVSSSKAYVSSLYRNKVYILNTQNYTVTDSITLPYKNTEGMCIYNTDAFICTWDSTGNKIYKVDALTDKVTQTIQVAGYAPKEILLDKEQTLWVLAGDGLQIGKIATLTRIDPSTGNILASWQFPPNAEPVKPVFNTTKDTLYFIEANQFGSSDNNGIYRMGIHDATLPPQPLIAARALQYFWALGIDPRTGYIYVGDPKGFIQNGSVHIYTQNGAPIDSFAVGVGPGHFYF